MTPEHEANHVVGLRILVPLGNKGKETLMHGLKEVVFPCMSGHAGIIGLLFVLLQDPQFITLTIILHQAIIVAFTVQELGNVISGLVLGHL